MRELYNKHKDLIPYLFFGVCTTVVNIAAYWLCAHALGMGVMTSTIAAWILAVLFAYITNRKWVFHSAARGMREIAKEIAAFFGCRITTGILDWLMMYVFVDRLHFNDVLIKTIANIIVIVLNYVASKLIIFRKKD